MFGDGTPEDGRELLVCEAWDSAVGDWDNVGDAVINLLFKTRCRFKSMNVLPSGVEKEGKSEKIKWKNKIKKRKGWVCMCVVGCLYHNLFVPQGTTIASQVFFFSKISHKNLSHNSIYFSKARIKMSRPLLCNVQCTAHPSSTCSWVFPKEKSKYAMPLQGFVNVHQPVLILTLCLFQWIY